MFGLKRTMLRRTFLVAKSQKRCFHHHKQLYDQHRVMLTGCLGQIGSELVEVLRSKFGRENVISTDVRATREVLEQGPFEFCRLLTDDDSPKTKFFFV